MMYTAANTFDDIRAKVVADLGCGCGMLSIAAVLVGADKVYGVDIDCDALGICKENLQDLGIIDLPSDGESESAQEGDGSEELFSDNSMNSEDDSADSKDSADSDSNSNSSSENSEAEDQQSNTQNDGDLVELHCGDVLDTEFLSKTLAGKNIATIITNPPFGTKNNAGVDVAFLEAALALAQSNPTLRAIYSMHKSSTRAHLEKKAASWKCKLTVIAEMKFDLPAKYSFHKQENVVIAVDLLRFELPSQA